MWAHYGDQHRGIVLEIDSEDATLNERRTTDDDFRHLRKVNYADERPELILSEFSFEDLFLLKSNHWGYENEWRIIKSLSDATKTINAEPHDIYLFNLPSRAIKRLILGARVPERIRLNIENELSLNSHLSHITVQQAQLEDRKFAIRII